MADHVGGPIFRHTGTDQPVKGQGCDPHQVRSRFIVRLRLKHTWANLDQGLKQALGEAILDEPPCRIVQVLLHDMGESVHHPVGQLPLRQ
jgi:hypothetical protein